MARALLKTIVRGSSGRSIQNARVFVYESGTTTPVDDLYPSAVGGSPQVSLVSNSQGEIIGWLETPRNVALKTTDNNDLAFYTDAAAIPADPGDALAAHMIAPDAHGVNVPGDASALPFLNPGFAATNTEDAVVEAASGERVTELDEADSVSVDDLFLMVDDPAGTPTSVSVTADLLRDFMAAGNGQSLATTMPGSIGISGNSAQGLTAGLFHARPFRVRKGGTAVHARVSVSTAVGASTVHMGLYTQPEFYDWPINLELLHDVGTFSAASVAVVDKVGSWAIPDNTLIWLVIATAATGVALFGDATQSPLVPTNTNPGTLNAGYTQTGYVGSMPADLELADGTFIGRMPSGILYN